MTNIKRQDNEQLTRQRAAEHLADVAYALTAGGPLELTIGGERVTVPIGDELRMKRDVTSMGDHVELELELTWSATMPSEGDLS